MVDDPFGAEGSEYCNELTYDDDLHDPPTEEISGEHVTAYEFDETSESLHNNKMAIFVPVQVYISMSYMGYISENICVGAFKM